MWTAGYDRFLYMGCVPPTSTSCQLGSSVGSGGFRGGYVDRGVRSLPTYGLRPPNLYSMPTWQLCGFWGLQRWSCGPRGMIASYIWVASPQPLELELSALWVLRDRGGSCGSHGR